MAGTNRSREEEARDLCLDPALVPRVILVEPQMGENIGATARAMLNCGLTDLYLVKPRDGWPNPKAEAMSSGAFAKMGDPALHEDFSAAIADCSTVYATTARSRDLVKPVLTARAAATDMVARIQRGEKIALVFGGERAGLDNEDIARCDLLITVPLNPAFSSLNLGQAVLLVCYEWMQAACLEENPAIQTPTGESPPVTKADFEHFFNRLEENLEIGGYFKEDNLKRTTLRNLRAMLTRMAPTDQEIRSLHGMISALIRQRNKVDHE